ncbi:MAG TPA: hypothetical protein VN698_13915 [Bacteroidia bacterium]|nr:hypothetical protein [Bacteroidia bacterium]
MEARKRVYESSRGINPTSKGYETVNTNEITTFLVMPLKQIRKYIPQRAGNRSSHCFHLLVIIKDRPRKTINGLNKMLHSSACTIEKNVQYLESMGYVKAIGKPRLVPALQRFKIERAFTITPLGQNVVKRIMLGE